MDPMDVLVVGAGPTGLTLALALSRHGLKVRLIEREEVPSQGSRALAVHARTLEIFEDLGVLRPIMSQGLRLEGFSLHGEGEPIAQLSLEDTLSPYPFVLSIPQNRTEAILAEALAEAGVEVERGVTLRGLRTDDFAAVVELEGPDAGALTEVRAPWVIGCDGAHSAVRQALDIPFEGVDVPGTFALGDFKVAGMSLPRERGAAVLAPGGVVMFIPLPRDGYHRIITQVAPGELPEDPDAGDLESLLRRRLGAEVALTDPLWLSRFEVHQRQAARWRVGPVFLAGDAAHVHSPIGGQGMNVGIQDAYNLAWKLALTHSGRARSDLLESYEAERAPVARALLRATEGATRMVTLKDPLSRRLRNTFLGVATDFAGMGERVTEELAEVAVRYRESFVVAEDAPRLIDSRLIEDRSQEAPSVKDWGRFSAAPRAGDRAPDVPLLGGPSERPALIRLYDCTRGPHFTLLLFDGEADTDAGYARLTRIAEAALRRVSGRLKVFIIVPGRGVPEALKGRDGEVQVVFDPGLTAHTRYGALAESLYLIRPDGHIGYRSQPAQESGLLAYLDRLLLP